jgi:hypothetical protein
MSRAYSLYSLPMAESGISQWDVCYFLAGPMRRLMIHIPLGERALRWGIHVARITKNGSVVVALKGQILYAPARGLELFSVLHIPGGGRPLNIEEAPDGTLYFGQYSRNHNRHEVSVFASTDSGEHWYVAYTFPAGTVRHVHRVQYDSLRHSLLVLTGDSGSECGIYQTTDRFCTLNLLFGGTQKARAVSVIPIPQGWVIPGDANAERNHILLLESDGKMQCLDKLPSSAFSTCQTRQGYFISTGVEPSKVNTEPHATIWASKDGLSWRCVYKVHRDCFSGKLFQYASLQFADGLEDSDSLYATGISVQGLHHKTLVWDGF